MKYRTLGNTGIKVSEIAFGAEWYVERPYEEVEEIVRHCENNGINFLDCWMSEPTVRTNLGKAIKDTRDKWVIQGHIGATWQNNQYVRTREMDKVKEAFEDFMARFQMDTLDFGMVHYVDELKKEFEAYMETANNDVFMEWDVSERHDDQWALRVIHSQLNGRSGTCLQEMNRKERDRVLHNLKVAGLTIRQLERLTGINRGVIQRA